MSTVTTTTKTTATNPTTATMTTTTMSMTMTTATSTPTSGTLPAELGLVHYEWMSAIEISGCSRPHASFRLRAIDFDDTSNSLTTLGNGPWGLKKKRSRFSCIKKGSIKTRKLEHPLWVLRFPCFFQAFLRGLECESTTTYGTATTTTTTTQTATTTM